MEMNGNVRVQILMVEKAYQATRIEALRKIIITRELGHTVSPGHRRTTCLQWPPVKGGVMPLTSRDVNKPSICNRCSSAPLDIKSCNLSENREQDELVNEMKEYVKYMVSSFIRDDYDQTCG